MNDDASPLSPSRASADADATRTFVPETETEDPQSEAIGLREPLPATTPAQVGGFRVQEFLGAGGFGEVYRARDQHLQRDVALKLANPEALTSRERAERFLREARAAAALQHPNIVPIFDAGEERGRYYIAAAFIRGNTMQAELKQGKPTFERAVHWIRHLAQALAYAHSRGIVHRDVKPANIMLNERDEPMLMDFGLALRLDDEHVRTQEGKVLGTPRYMSPEQARGDNAALGAASDQYSLGVLMFELLTGRAPFLGAVELVLALHSDADPPRPRTLDKRIPRDLETICLKCLEKDPARRYHDCTALADDLRRYADEEPITARHIGVLERAAKWRRKNPLAAMLAVSIAVVLIAGAAVAGFFAWQSNVNAGKYREEAVVSKQNEDRATSNFNLAKENEKKAVEQAKIADRRTEQLKAETRNLARTAGFVADAAWEHGDVVKANELLDSVPEELRQWEWRYRKRRFQGSYATLYGHASWCFALAFFPDGSRVVTGGHDSVVRIWDTTTGRELFTLSGHSRPVLSVAITSDGKRIASGSADQSVRLWDAESGAETMRIDDFGTPVYSIAFSPDDTVIAVAGGVFSEPGHIDIRNARSGESIRKILGHKGVLQALSFSPDGSHLATASQDKTVRLWDVSKGLVVRTLREHESSVECVAHSPDGRQIASGANGELCLWEAATGRLQKKLKVDERVRGICFSPDGRRFACCSGSVSDGKITIWDAANCTEVQTFLGHTSEVRSVAFSPDGQILASTSYDQTVRLWDVRSNRDSLPLTSSSIAAECVSISPDGSKIVTGNTDYSLMVWDSTTARQLLVPRKFGGGTKCVAFSPGGRWIASGGLDKLVRLWNATTGKELRRFQGHQMGIACVTFSPDSKRIVSGGGEFRKSGEIIVWDAESGQKVYSMDGHKDRVTCVGYSDDGRWIASGDENGGLTIWDALCGREVRTTKLSSVYCLCFSPDNRSLVTGGFRQLKVWDVATGDNLLTLSGHTSILTSVRFSPDGQRMVSTCHDKTARVWNTSTGSEVLALTEQESRFLDASFISDGNYLVSVSSDKVLRTWNAFRDSEIRTLRGHTANVNCVSFSPDGKHLASSGDDRTIRVWRVADGEETSIVNALPAALTRIAFGSDGTQLHGIDRKGITKTWDIGTGEELPGMDAAPAWTNHGRHPTQPLFALRDGNVIRILNVGQPSEHELRLRAAKARFDAEWHRAQARRTDGDPASAQFATAFHRSQLALHEPGDPRHWVDLLRACEKLGDDRLAIQTANRVLAKSPELDFVRRTRATLRAKHLDVVGAAADWLLSSSRR